MIFLQIGEAALIGNKVGKVIDICNGYVKIYCIDNTGGYTVSAPLENVKKENFVEELKKPQRYNKRGTLECWDVILDQEMSFLEGNILKYLWRYKEKGGVEDLKKARVYLDKLIQETSKE